MTHTPLTTQQLDEIQARRQAATPGPWGVYESGPSIDIAADLHDTGCGYRARRAICRLDDEPLDNDPTHREWTAEEDWAQVQADAAFIAHAREDVDVLLADNQHLRQQLAEMTHLRDNALRALYRDDVETDIDLEETIGAPFYGPGWDWDEPDLKRVVSVAAAAVRPAFGKLTQQRDQALARVAELERPAVEVKRNEIRQSFTELSAQCEQDRDYEAAWNFQRRLQEHEEQWAREDAAARPVAASEDTNR